MRTLIKRFTWIVVFVLNLANTLTAQKEGDQWLFCYLGSGNLATRLPGSTLNFNSKPMKLDSVKRIMSFDKANASICDKNGKLLLACNSCWVAGPDNNILENGGGLNPIGPLVPPVFRDFCRDSISGLPLTQSILILPNPRGDSTYYIFHTNARQHFYPPISPNNWTVIAAPTYISIADMRINKIVKKNHPILDDSIFVCKMAVKHKNKRDWWVLMPMMNQNRYVRFLLAPDTVIGPSYQEIGDVNSIDGILSGQACFSHDGKHYVKTDLANQIFLFDFDRETGLLSNYRKMTLPEIYDTGCAFSPSNRYLYISTAYHIYQYDMQDPNIESSRMTVAEFDGFQANDSSFPTYFWQMLLGPDCRIYMNCSGGNPRHLHVIANPDRRGPECTVLQHSIRLSSTNNNTIPNIPQFRIDEPWPCDSSAVVSTPGIFEIPLSLSPNPVSDELQIGYDLRGDYQHSVAEVWDMQGRLIVRQSLDSYKNRTNLSTRDWLPGIYAIRIVQYGRVLAWDKVVKQ
jgi:hypothetical protein